MCISFFYFFAGRVDFVLISFFESSPRWRRSALDRCGFDAVKSRLFFFLFFFACWLPPFLMCFFFAARSNLIACSGGAPPPPPPPSWCGSPPRAYLLFLPFSVFPRLSYRSPRFFFSFFAVFCPPRLHQFIFSGNLKHPPLPSFSRV